VQAQFVGAMTEIFIARLGDRNRRVQVALLGFRRVMEVAGDLMAPYFQNQSTKVFSLGAIPATESTYSL
jgi:hypothetical protein